MTVELRPPVREDAAAISAALNEFNVSAGFDLDSPEEVAVGLEFPSFDLDRNTRVALVDGRIAGYSEAYDPGGDGRFVFADVRAANPDASAALLDFVEERAREIAPGGKIRLWTTERAAAWGNFLESRGYELHRYSLRMSADLESEPPDPHWPEGISVRTFSGEEDERLAYDLQQETFADQGEEHVAEPFEDWRHWMLREPFDPGLWFFAIDGEQLTGVSLCRGEHGGDEWFGWISVLGVRKPWRGRGLGSALLLHSFRELHARGKRRVGLGVRADNATGAVRLYERVGMSVQRRIVWYSKEVV